MRIALLYRKFGLDGSLPRFNVELARQLSENHDVHVFSIDALTDRDLAPACTFHDVPVAAVGSGSGFDARELLSYARNAARLVRDTTFDVVHARTPSTWVGDVLHVSGVARAETELQGHSGLRFVAATVRHPGNAARLLIERRALTNPGLRRLHVDAPSVRDDLERLYGVDPEHVLVVLPGVNLEQFTPTADRAAARHALGLNEQAFTLVFCGHDFHRKGLDRAIDALAASRMDATLVVVGASTEVGPFEAQAAAAGVAHRVRFLGARSDAWRAYQAADAFVLPTRADIWGITVIEAMACGTPPLVSSAAGASHVVDDGVTGFVLPEPFDARAWRDALESLAGDPSRAANMGRAAHEATLRFSWVEHARRVVQDFEAMLAGTVPTRRPVG